ncbi:hypothetical protein JL722_3339 [Aureococcus anophagefferens]|nr:hypothetical protein JL722_3339 [Aureococcus anophagefferens]KAH8098191.1 hypothetical protein JL720_1121 [Aureococcus anophagefferens]
MRRRVSSGARRREPEPPTYDAAAIQALFDTWADDVEGGAMGMDGLVDLCGALEIDPASDVRLLALLWRLGAKQPALILREEWAEGMAAIGCDSLEKLKAYVEALEPHAGQDKRAKFPTSKAHISAVFHSPHAMDRRAFRDFFKFVFLFSREGTHRTIEKDIVAALLPIAIGDRSAHTASFLAFLETSSTTRVTLDQWCSFLEFSDTVAPDFEGYEEDGAWPLLLDEYVEQARADKAV